VGIGGEALSPHLPNLLLKTNAPSGTILIRLLVGAVFLSEGIQKFLFPVTVGVGRFAKIGIPSPQFFAPFVGVVEIVCGTLLIIGLVTRLATIPLIIDISVAVITTKIPMLSKTGFWSMAHEARTDYCMLLGLIFLILVGSGPFSLIVASSPPDRKLKGSDFGQVQRIECEFWREKGGRSN
jgi:uncharacterized membrane protein YphA (DoxX/SURF4 family)